MLFSSLVFLSIFLPVVTLLYFTVKQELRNYVLLIASLIFYAWGEPRYLAIMLVVILLNYIFAILVESGKYKKLFLSIAIIGNLSFLIYFKYFNFIIENLNKIRIFNISPINVIMPIGISFYTFQALSYVMDVYRGEVKAQKSVYNVALYVTFFPQLIAGPIVKYHDIEKEIMKRKVDFLGIYSGLKRFSFGLGKKIILANTFGAVVDEIFKTNIEVLDYKIMWLGAVCYTLQLYFDFSGYSDMAIGLGRIFGFHFLENFNYPYIATSVTDFWHRWHISLSTWFKEYVYIPLGGNRKGLARQILNILIVWTLTGIWHGAGWNFLFWGLWFALFLILEKLFLGELLKNAPVVFGRVYTLAAVLISWVFFALEKPGEILAYLQAMFGLNGVGLMNTQAMFLGNEYLVLLIIALVACLPVGSLLIHRLKSSKTGPAMALYRVGEKVIPAALLILSVAYIVDASYNPFLYFRF